MVSLYFGKRGEKGKEFDFIFAFHYIRHKLPSKQLTANKMERLKKELGSLEMQLLAYAQMRKQETLSLGKIAPILGITKKQERELFSRLSRAGIIIRLKRGVYLIPPRLPTGGRWTVSGYYVLSKLMDILKGQYQISGPNAFNFYGFDDQVPNRIYVYNDRMFGEKNIGGTAFVFIKTDGKRLGSTRSLKTPDDIDTVMVSKTRALVDAVYDWSRYNTIPRAYGWIAETLQNEPESIINLIGDTLKYSNKGTIKRIGYLLDQLGINDDRLIEMKRQLSTSKSLIPWIPGQAAKGSINREWGLIINGSIT
jgi:predicted transcriptional regulator of viral defense system